MKIVYRNILLVSVPVFLFAGVTLYFTLSGRSDREDMFETRRKAMVNGQIKARGIEDPEVLNAMLKVERQKFVPENQKDMAYKDRPLPIGEGQTISQPFIVAYMTEALGLDSDDRVLEIGTGSGYQAAVLAEIVKQVFSIEIKKDLAESAAKTLKDLGYDNVNIKWGDGYKGWPEHAPFDAIIVTAAPPQVPAELVDQLKPGGNMIVPAGRFFQELLLVTKTDKGTKEERLIPVRFVPMVRAGDEGG